ncbi:MAG: phosphoribosylglycinamide formyltransferase [Nitrososphaerales archaeon]
MTIHIGVLASGRGSNLQAIIDAIKSGYIKNAEIKVVISDKADAYALERARAAYIPAVYIDPTPYKGRREEYDKLIINTLIEHGVTPDNGLVLLAGYMRILSQPIIQLYKMRILNIHPSLLPAFPGLKAQKQALEYGVKYSGCTVHFADVEVDKGPIILQAVVPVYDDDTEESLSERILREEHRIYPEAVKLFVEGRLKIEGRRVKIL